MKKNLKKDSKRTNNKGITLIALIITIIVLLILAGVTINLTLGENGIFRTAEMAGKNYTQAQDKELAGLADFENTINNIIAGTGNSSGGDGDTDTPETPVEQNKFLKDIAQPGDYVKYDTGLSSGAFNGIVTFRVLYNDDTYGLQIISDKNVEYIRLGRSGVELTEFQTSMSDYNNAIAILNERAEKYATRSPYALDGRCVGSVPTIETDGTFNAKNTEVEGIYDIPANFLPEGVENGDIECKKLTDENYITDQTVMQASNIWTTGEYYWLASRNVYSNSAWCEFIVRYVHTDGNLSNRNLCFASGTISSYEASFGLRPVISLNQDVKVLGGDGTSKATAYELGL